MVEALAGVPKFRKYDRYKVSSYLTYNFRILQRYDLSIWQKICRTDLWDQIIINEIGADIESARILDVGCATGRLLYTLGKSGAKKLAGVDLAPKILEVANNKFANLNLTVELKSTDAEDSLPWSSESFEVVTLTGVLHHFCRPVDALMEINRILVGGGRLIIIDPCFFTPIRHIFNLYLRFFPQEGDYRFYTVHKAVHLLDDSLWTSTKFRKISSTSYMVSTSKKDI